MTAEAFEVEAGAERWGVGHQATEEHDGGGARSPIVQVRLGSRVMELNVEQSVQPTVATMTDLGQHAGDVFDAVLEGAPTLVTKRGRFVAMIVPVDNTEVEQQLAASLAHANAGATSHYVDAMYRRIPGERLFSIAQAAAELGVPEPSTPA